ncbi:PREDICTED: uncharacterized protein LOC107082279 [Cyprinodon variegatus]|uniref:uncharacterized protein LOC107082279 n=1 Tax=Cyprinodon variegatus TaxID=28743 RepID=UPI000742A82F|nr:PREDICTED: uncharacterized protein LOC107082279 [Cyprinodon variegatus]
MEKLGSQVGGFGPVANAVGLGALVISLLLENLAQSMGKPTMGTADILRRVFAEEKGNEVRDLMDEYMKRMILYLRQQQDLIAHTRHLESQLSTQLTRLRNSMLTDNQMSTRLLNQWVNGAAFHTQMLIHLARLEGSDGTVAVRAADIYNKDVNRLLEKYQSYLIDNLEGKYYSPIYTSVAVCCFFFEENKMRATGPGCLKARRTEKLQKETMTIEKD